MIIAIVIAVLFTVSAVCAVDSEIQDIGTCNSTDTVSAADDSDLKMDDADEKLADEVDFIALNETINGNSSSYIELERDYHGSFNERNGIQINRPNVVIDGNGHNIQYRSKLKDLQY